ncbi:DUF3278 domain-containing protein [Bacillus sp. Hm123]|uniref:DUF3278 domain-containing protein n=1 Tax=Bacillus sp. Hm123 TaxID=3450745 RepID=UPI003F443A14
MEKSWISIFLPDDEYKERKVLFFLAESAVIMFLLLFGLLISQSVMSNFELDPFIALLIPFAVSLYYMLIRYMLSGIEFSDVMTEQAFKRKKRLAILQSIAFFGFFTIAAFIFGMRNWDAVGQATLAAIFLFLMNYISLRRSYRKNKELL